VSLKDHGASEQDNRDPASLKDLGVEHHVNDKSREQHAEGRSNGEHHVKDTLDERQEQGILEWVEASDVMTSLSRHSHLPLFKYHSGERAWAAHKIWMNKTFLFYAWRLR
jgi:hypothetical protein